VGGEGRDAARAANALASLRALIDLAEEISWRAVDVLRLCPNALVLRTNTAGIDRAAGGVFERETIALIAFDSAGLVARWEQFDVGQQAEALQRFDELVGTAPATLADSSTEVDDTGGPEGGEAPRTETARGPGGWDPTRIPPNQVTRVGDRQWQLAGAGDWQGLRDLCSPSLVYEDRRRTLRTSGDRDTFLASMQISAAPGVVLHRECLAAPNERLALEHRRWTRTEEVVLFEVESLTLTEIDAGGRVEAVILFDPEDRAAADVELIERALRIDAEVLPPKVIQAGRALADHDPAGFRAAIPDDFFCHDHRPIGLGRIEGADEYVASLSALAQLSSDARIGILYPLCDAPSVKLSMARVSGTNREGGAFETFHLLLRVFRDGQIAGVELFDAGDRANAEARFLALVGSRVE
jgi:hypothetical protein